MRHPLDRPIWNALASSHAAFAEGNTLIKRYPPDIHPFACGRDDGPESMQALAALAAPGDTQVLLQADEIAPPPGFDVSVATECVQMIADGAVLGIEDSRIHKLGEADAADMLELATLTKPGPFTLRAQALGNFWGIRNQGQLVAMSGERLKVDEMTEVSGVCTHPDFRGRGFGKLMKRYAAAQISARGETTFLHTYASNDTAIALYEKLGFRIRTRMHVAFMTRVG
ncbi:MAG: GNAT family N-acetyltransferase [Mesorhizobium sp.]|nr:GNAT family N-acetyltransferase [Mesorhizobium sp.]MBL8576864.1 GNAT family N-acetyltransferase [Mesorhizobium sp.]